VAAIADSLCHLVALFTLRDHGSGRLELGLEERVKLLVAVHGKVEGPFAAVVVAPPLPLDRGGCDDESTQS
jgi:hypothetical protein